MADKKTGELMNVLNNLSDEKELDAFIASEDMNDMKKFADYFFSIESVQRKKQAQIIEESCVSRKYGYEILSYSCKKKPGRDRIIALMIAGGLKIDEVQRGLEIADLNPLYSKDRRDAIIIFGINHGKSVMEINSLLSDRGFEGLEGTYDD